MRRHGSVWRGRRRAGRREQVTVVVSGGRRCRRHRRVVGRRVARLVEDGQAAREVLERRRGGRHPRVHTRRPAAATPSSPAAASASAAAAAAVVDAGAAADAAEVRLSGGEHRAGLPGGSADERCVVRTGVAGEESHRAAWVRLAVVGRAVRWRAAASCSRGRYRLAAASLHAAANRPSLI